MSESSRKLELIQRGAGVREIHITDRKNLF